MKQISDQIIEVIENESSKCIDENAIKSLDKTLADLKKAGLIKQPIYDFPLVDTIGKTYYNSINKAR